ncbi:fibronectin type III domain-containing protein [Lactococcus petauri]|uniref:fibronectin type III domain-containing protein n=1 Tax=Lactococcus petauri TaxID=1940789 RepID=UPI0022DF08B7|nr:fibronectin type III domain-containing protein [Lactococcus petauri]
MATNYYHIAYSKSADGKEGFTKTYPAPNLLPNSTWNLGGGTWTFNPINDKNFEILQPESDKPESKILHAFPITSSVQQTSNIPHPIPVRKEEEITISFDFKDKGWTRSSNLLVVRVFPDKDTPNSQANSLQNVSVNSNTFGITENTDEFKRFNFTIKVIADGYLDILPYNSESSGDYESWWREIKVEHGKIVTPWMPHESEVTSKDYPTYIGTYTDENETSSTDPADYTWEMMNYRIYLDGVAVAGSKLLSAKVEDLNPDTSYTIQVKQVSGEEESDFSDSVTFKTNVQK